MKIHLLILLVSWFALLLQVQGKSAISEQHRITLQTDELAGKMYNLWDVRVLNAPESWLRKGFAEGIQSGSEHINNIMNVRALGGKTNHSCEWFKGVDDEGELICDFSGLYEIIDAQIRVGFKPWIVLDQVPHAMTSAEPNEIYGIVNAADDMTLWARYVRKTVQGLVERYGLETVSQWMFRVGTEPNNTEHWADSKEKYFEHYDYTVGAVQTVIKEPIIGPGNFLMLRSVQSAAKAESSNWTFEILDHCVNGRNYFTGKTGTHISFYSQSCYGVAGQSFPYEINMKQFRDEVAKYPSLEGLPHEIHEYGEIKGILGNGPNVSLIEWKVGMYAQTVDVAYRYGTRRIFNWGGGGGQLVDCLVKMEDGNRIEVSKDEKEKLDFGAIAAWKDGKLYAIVYSHDPKVNGTGVNTIDLTLKGKDIVRAPMWRVDQHLYDKNNVVIYEQYKDIAEAGIEPKEGAYELATFYRKYNLRQDGRKIDAIMEANREKYEKIAKMKKLRSGERIRVSGGALKLQVKLEGSGFHFLVFSPGM